jgi:2-keto-3-deoxy-galactonokinase
LLIGSELEALSKKAVDSITLVGEARLLAHYLEAFAVLSIDAAVSIADAATATIHGQLAVYRRLYA